MFLPVKIAFLCPTISRTCGGIFEIERNLAQALARLPSTNLEIFGPSDEYAELDLPAWLPLRPRHFAYRGPSSFRYSSELRDAFLVSDADLVHLHALWMYNSILVQDWAHRWKRPYLVTANGMLEPWALQNSGWKKRIAEVLYERKALQGAACIQANSEAEFRSVRAFGLRNPICIIPNGIALPDETNQMGLDKNEEATWEKLRQPGRKILLYLGRLHPKKGLVNLLKAWSKIKNTAGENSNSEWLLAIAGWDQEGHQNELEKLAKHLQLTASVAFLGSKFNEAKSACYRNCDAFVLPSFSEGLPMVVLEAWSYGKPVLITPGCNLPEGFSAHAALRIEPEIDSIVDGLRQLFAMSANERQAMGHRGLDLVKDRFTWPKVALKMRSVYDWMLGGGSKPECIID